MNYKKTIKSETEENGKKNRVRKEGMWKNIYGGREGRKGRERGREGEADT